MTFGQPWSEIAKSISRSLLSVYLGSVGRHPSDYVNHFESRAWSTRSSANNDTLHHRSCSSCSTGDVNERQLMKTTRDDDEEKGVACTAILFQTICIDNLWSIERWERERERDTLGSISVSSSSLTRCTWKSDQLLIRQFQCWHHRNSSSFCTRNSFRKAACSRWVFLTILLD